jgi:hypothetical protein
MAQKTNILLDYYEGAYGPTIRIDTQSIETVTQIRDIFLELSAAKVSEVKFHEIDSIKTTNIRALTLQLVAENKDSEKSLVLEKMTAEGPIFCWSRSSKGWNNCAGLLDGLLKHGRSGHQYLTEEGIDDALVEMSFLE